MNSKPTQTVYKAGYEGSGCILFTLEDAFQFLEVEIENSYKKEDEPLELTLTVCEMTEKEIENLPEFDGF